MATHSIGTGGDFSTPQAWEDDIPATLTEPRVGQLKNEEFSFTGINNAIDFSAHTTTSTNSITFECQASASFKDNANVRTNALRYNASNGAAIKTVNGRCLHISGNVGHITVRNIQFQKNGNNYYTVPIISDAATSATTRIFKDLIVDVIGSDTNARGMSFNVSSTIINVLVMMRGSGTQQSAIHLLDNVSGQTWNVIGCTLVRPSNLTAAGTGINNLYGNNTGIVTNTTLFGFSTDAAGLDTGTDYNATDKSDAGSGLPDPSPDHNVYDLVQSNQFEQSSDSGGSHDYRTKSGAGLENAGNLDSTNSPQDISGTTRNSPPEIGVWELAITDTFPAWTHREWHTTTMSIAPL